MTTGITHVFIRNLELVAHIGVHGYEHGNPQPVRVNIDMSVALTGDIADRLANVVDYEAVTEKIRAIVAEGHINLAETLADRIAESCLADRRVRHVKVRIEKLHALKGAEAAGVEIERTAS